MSNSRGRAVKSMKVYTRDVQPFGVSAPHQKKSCLRPLIKYIATCNHTHKKSHNVLNKFTILCWAALITILSCVWSPGCRLDTSGLYPERRDGKFLPPTHLPQGWQSSLYPPCRRLKDSSADKLTCPSERPIDTGI